MIFQTVYTKVGFSVRSNLTILPSVNAKTAGNSDSQQYTTVDQPHVALSVPHLAFNRTHLCKQDKKI